MFRKGSDDTEWRINDERETPGRDLGEDYIFFEESDEFDDLLQDEGAGRNNLIEGVRSKSVDTDDGIPRCSRDILSPQYGLTGEWEDGGFLLDIVEEEEENQDMLL